MSENQESREAWLVKVVQEREEHSKEQLKKDIENYHKLRWGWVLAIASSLPRYRGLKCFFVDNNVHGLKQSFYVACKFLMASHKEAELGGDVFATYEPFLYGLLSDSQEIFDWLTHAELKEKDDVKTPHFYWHQFQLVLRRDDEALRQTIAIVAKKGR
ncbi:hypothetical protein QMA71_28620, partial [Pseudomonas otitidis]